MSAGPSRQPRLRSEIAVKATPGEEAGAASATRNLSPGGMCFRAQSALEVGRTYQLELALPAHDGGALACTGRIVWSRRDGDGFMMGVEFVKISLEDQRRLYRFLDTL